MSRSTLGQARSPSNEAAIDDPAHEEPRRLLKLPDVSIHGVTVLYTPPAEVVADIVFVHGLMGHPLRTWLYCKVPSDYPLKISEGQKKKWKVSTILGKRKNETDEEDIQGRANEATSANQACYFWPFHALPQDFKNIRVLVYGYDSQPTQFYMVKTNRMAITQHAQDLRNRVANERRTC